jgi:3-phytase
MREGSISPVLAGVVDAVSGTDGIDVASVPRGTSFPAGLFVAQDGSNGGSNQNYKLVPWGRIARGVTPQLLVDTTADPRTR